MAHRPLRAIYALPLLLPLTPACTLQTVHSASGKPQLVGHGLVDGYLGLGFPEIGDPVEFHLLSKGISVGINFFNLLRAEVGVAGFDLGVGPIHLGVGTLLYEPEPPPYPRKRPKVEDDPPPEDDGHED